MKNRAMSSIIGRKEILQTRKESIARLRNTTMELQTKRVEECKNILLESYEKSSISHKISNVITEKRIENYRFKSIGLHQAIRLDEFINSSYYWGPYFSDVGRIIAQAERQYIHRRIARYVHGRDEKISALNPDYSILNKTIKELVDINLDPNIILAPVEMLPSFVMYYRNNLEWSQRDEQVVIDNCKLKIIWSHEYAKLKSFVIFNSEFSTWHVLPDDKDDKQMITIAFGLSKGDFQKMAYWVEIIAFYQINNPRAFRRINLST
jgi:hypothetical protein